MPCIPLNDETRRSTPAPKPDCESRKNAALQDASSREQAQKSAREVVGGGDKTGQIRGK